MYAPQQIAKTFVAANLVRARIGGKVENRPAALVVQIAVGPTKCFSRIPAPDIAHREVVRLALVHGPGQQIFHLGFLIAFPTSGLERSAKRVNVPRRKLRRHFFHVRSKCIATSALHLVIVRVPILDQLELVGRVLRGVLECDE